MIQAGEKDSAPAQISVQISAQIDHLLKPGTPGLRFPPSLEAQFERDTGAPRSRRLWREGLISIIAFNLFYIGEWLLTRQVTRHELVLQLGLITPLCLLVNLTMRFNPPRWLREGSISLMACVIACAYLQLQLGKGPLPSPSPSSLSSLPPCLPPSSCAFASSSRWSLRSSSPSRAFCFSFSIARSKQRKK